MRNQGAEQGFWDLLDLGQVLALLSAFSALGEFLNLFKLWFYKMGILKVFWTLLKHLQNISSW